MSVSFHPDTLAFAVVEYLDSSRHLLEVVEHAPENEQQYRLVCVAHTADEGDQKISGADYTLLQA